MLGKIIKIENNTIYVKTNIDLNTINSILNLYVLLKDNNSSFLGEIINIDNDFLIISGIGEIVNNSLVYGFIKKPSFNATVDLINPNYIENIISYTGNPNSYLTIGNSPFYKNTKINASINNLFASHMAIIGLTGSGKSCGFSRIIQNLFDKENLNKNINIAIFDAYGEYHNAFSNINHKENFYFKSYGLNEDNQNKIIIPFHLLDMDDIALLLEITKKSQITIIDKALRYVDLFKSNDETTIKYKNSIISDALLDILLSGRPASQIRDQIMSALAKFNTPTLNLETIISQPGYNRTFRQCLLIDSSGKINAIELITNFLQSFLIENIPTKLPDGSYSYYPEDLLNALDFTLISEGIWKSEKVFDDANILKVRLNTLINSDNIEMFKYSTYINKNDYIKSLFTTNEGNKAQIINFNIDSLDDRFAKIIVKIYSKLFYNYAKSLKDRASTPFNIFLEEAHRYVQNDTDNEILGYNIFERITKEGRKYGVLLGLITQRPKELSETVLSQCSNFLLFKSTHPNDVNYIGESIPNITKEITERIKILQPGICLAFGTAFKLPILVKLEMPNPAPYSASANINNVWFNNN